MLGSLLYKKGLSRFLFVLIKMLTLRPVPNVWTECSGDFKKCMILTQVFSEIFNVLSLSKILNVVVVGENTTATVKETIFCAAEATSEPQY